MRIFFYFLLLACLINSGCGKHFKRAKLPPVKEGWRQPAAGKNAYIVQKNDTLYSIAWAFGLDYRDLIKINHLTSPYKLYLRQRLYIISSEKNNKNKNHTYTNTVNTANTANTADITDIKNWQWPVHGLLISKFDNNNKLRGGNKGVDIKGRYGEAILAANSGKIVYSGTGIPSYGKLIIIKHNDEYLSAYAYNQEILVAENQEVVAGQKIATMGKNDEGKVCLHFEIRKAGKPVNPLEFLPK
jgi:lipoprotein NlpD